MRPAEMQFTTSPGKSCSGYLFEHERSTVCHEAAAAAVRAGLEDCEHTKLIYVAVLVDARQLNLLQEPS